MVPFAFHCGPGREDPRLPHHWYGGQQRKMRLAHQGGAFRRRYQLQDRGRWHSTFGALSQWDHVFFDNVGGTVLNEVLARINLKARIVLCGSISRSDTSEPGPANYFNLVARRGRMEGFTGVDFGPRFPEAIEALGCW